VEVHHLKNHVSGLVEVEPYKGLDYSVVLDLVADQLNNPLQGPSHGITAGEACLIKWVTDLDF
jgi:hypothetical protein